MAGLSGLAGGGLPTNRQVAVVALSALALFADQAGAQNLVENPGFEDTTASDGGGSATRSPFWTVGGGGGTSFVNSSAGAEGAHGGNWFAEFASTNANEADSSTLSQTIDTTSSTKTYVVSFFLANFGGPHDSFLATFGGQTVLSLTDASAFGYRKFSATITTNSPTAVLAFTAEQDPSAFGLDDISVEAEGAPAPVAGGGIASFCLLVAAVAFRRLRRRPV